MARPLKDGFDYFSVDVEFDAKVKSIQMVFKNDGTAWFLRFLQKAFQTNSGEVDLRPPFDTLFATEINCTVERMFEITAFAVSVGFCYEISERVYTSNGIQKRIEQILKERKEAKERNNKTKLKDWVPYSPEKPINTPNNELSDRITTEKAKPESVLQIISREEYYESVKGEINKAKEISEKGLLVLAKIAALKKEKTDNVKPS
jgi:hypothetical protein